MILALFQVKRAVFSTQPDKAVERMIKEVLEKLSN